MFEATAAMMARNDNDFTIPDCCTSMDLDGETHLEDTLFQYCP